MLSAAPGNKRTMTDKLDNLKDIISAMQSVAIAFSGGVDSSFLLR